MQSSRSILGKAFFFQFPVSFLDMRSVFKIFIPGGQNTTAKKKKEKKTKQNKQTKTKQTTALKLVWKAEFVD